MAERFYCPDPPRDGQLRLTGDEARHLAVVRRLGAGDVIEVFDGRGWVASAEITAVLKGSVDLTVKEPAPQRVAACELTLATAVPKGERFDWLVEKATELGVARLVPLRTERSTVDPRGGKLDRLRRVVIEASKQCGRSRLMVLAEPAEFDNYLKAESAGTRLIGTVGGPPVASGSYPAHESRAALAIGPEGGFTAAELAAATAAGWTAVGLGPTTLRIETAGLVGCAVILAHAEAKL